MSFTPPTNSHEITIDGVSHISSKAAAALYGYSSDYLDQLCRANKITGRLLGHAWYIEKGAISIYRKSHRLTKKMRIMLVASRLRLTLQKINPNIDRLQQEQYEEISAKINELCQLISDEWAPVK